MSAKEWDTSKMNYLFGVNFERIVESLAKIGFSTKPTLNLEHWKQIQSDSVKTNYSWLQKFVRYRAHVTYNIFTRNNIAIKR